MTLPTVQKIRLALENDIVDGRLAPGERVDPEAIAVRYGCSRTPVREALLALEQSGLVRVQPKHGTFVTKLTVGELMQRFEVMAELEAFCARLACRRADPHDLEAIEQALAACAQAAGANDSDRYYGENTKFHQAIYRAAHNEFLETETLRHQAALQPYRRRQLGARGRVRRSLEEHQHIFEAIRTGSEDEAGIVMTAHVMVQGERFNDLVAMLDSAA